jgi:predicted TIM-barrel fold metal-dependent hydrolase
MRGIQTFDCMMNFVVTAPDGKARESKPAYSVAHLLADTGHLVGQHPASYLFKGGGASPVSSVAEQIELMGEYGIEAGIIDIPLDDPDDKLQMLADYPKRFYGCVSVNPFNGLAEIRKLESLVAENPNIRACSVLGQSIQRPYNDKIYYPLYAKACELDLPVIVYVGIPGPRVPGAAQDPMALDEVMWFFPDLTVVMRHGGEPWEALCAKLLLKWPNLYYSTSGFAPKYYPKAIMDFANSRGADKVMYAGYTPTISFARISTELEKLELRDDIWPRFLRDNAASVFKL